MTTVVRKSHSPESSLSKIVRVREPNPSSMYGSAKGAGARGGLRRTGKNPEALKSSQGTVLDVMPTTG
jgi:hypothetical protein